MKTILSWSSGKDCAYALHVLRSEGVCEIVGLLTTMNAAFDRVAMHGVRREIVEAQARAVDLPLMTLPLPWPCSNEVYEDLMRECVTAQVNEGAEAIAFGDLFLQDIRAYREAKLAGSGLKPVFPLWGKPTRALAEEMIESGIEARIAVVDPKRLDPSFAGRAFDRDLLRALPDGVDACGENGEFHTCVTAGPMFSAPIEVELGAIVTRDGFAFADFTLRAGPSPG